MKFVVGVPRLSEQELLIECFDSIFQSLVRPTRVFLVDNGPIQVFECMDQNIEVIRPVENLGTVGSWNLIHKLAAPLSTVLLNADCSVAPDTFQKMFEVPAPAIVCAYAFGCVRIDHEVWQRIGDFDEGFWPAYYEDADYRHRCRIAGVEIINWDIEPSEVVSPGRTRSVHGITHGKLDFEWPGPGTIHEHIEKNKARFVAKWGGMPGEEKFSVPYG
jgi:GT2 family glycosyltransferase